MPTPSPTFCSFDQESDAGGASGSAVGDEEEVSDGFACAVEDEIVCDFVADDCEDTLVSEVADAIGLLVRPLDAVEVGASVLSVALLPVCDSLSLVSEGCMDRLGSAVTSVADAVAVTVAVKPFDPLYPPLVGGSVGHAVCGPNFLIK